MALPQKIIDKMTARRRDFHKHPERGWAEFRTTAVCADALLKLGWRVRFADEFIEPERVMGREVDAAAEKRRALEQGAPADTLARIGKYTGLCAELGEGAPLSVLRFDIDCVETAESDVPSHRPAALGFASVNAGLSHSCGHDGHAAIGLALAEMLSENAQNLRLYVYLFSRQKRACAAATPSRALRAARTISSQCTWDSDCRRDAYAEAPEASYVRRSSTRSSRERRRTREASLSAGATRLLAAAQAALAIHSIAPHSGGVMRVNVGVLRAGEGRNVVPPHALMKIETRGENGEIASYAYERAVQSLKGSAQMYGAELSVKKQGETITAESDEKLARIVADEALSIPGVTKTEIFRRMPGSDDACWFMRETQQSGGLATYVCIGADTAAGHHNGAFDFDEAALSIALETLHRAVMRINRAL